MALPSRVRFLTCRSAWSRCRRLRRRRALNAAFGRRRLALFCNFTSRAIGLFRKYSDCGKQRLCFLWPVSTVGSFFRPASRHGVGVALRAPSCLRPSPPGPAAEDWLCFVAPAEHRKPDRAGVSPRAADHGWNSQPPQHLTSSTLALRATLVTRSPPAVRRKPLAYSGKR